MAYMLLLLALAFALFLVWFLWRTGPKTRGRATATNALLLGLLTALAAVVLRAYGKRKV